MKNERICPWWMGYLLLIPLRKLGQSPKKILSPHIKKGMTIMDYGCAMGYFSLPLAKMTGNSGSVYCVDIQQKMLDTLQKRANKAGVGQIVKPILAGNNNYVELEGKVDFTMLFAVVHEIPNKEKLFKDLYLVMKSGGKLLFAEPKGHVRPDEFDKSIQLAQSAGFKVMEEKPIPDGLCVFLVK